MARVVADLEWDKLYLQRKEEIKEYVLNMGQQWQILVVDEKESCQQTESIEMVAEWWLWPLHYGELGGMREMRFLENSYSEV